MGDAIRIITPDQFNTAPWKNGGGITHEIATAPVANGFAWRLSIAEVTRNGPFSRFDGMQRILTVIEGAGMHLDSEAETIAARPGEPCRFPGELALEGKLIAGPVHNFNLIYDANALQADVQLITDQAPPTQTGTNETQHALYALSAAAIIGETRLEQGHVALFKTMGPVRIDSGGKALFVTLQT